MIEPRAARKAYSAPSRNFHQIVAGLLAVAALASVPGPVLAQSPKSVTGEWSTPFVSEGIAVHFVATPADTGDFHTQFLWWRFAAATACHARLEVFDLMGRKVTVAHDGPVDAGRHTIKWNGTDASGAWVRAGLYVCRLQAGAFRAERKLLMVP